MMSAIVMAIVEFNALDPEHLDKLMLLRSHYKQNSAFQSSNDGNDNKDNDLDTSYSVK